MHIRFTLLLVLMATLRLAAQQPAQYSMYMLDPMRWNPAYAGLEQSLSLTGTYRQQWTGLEGSPAGQRLSAHLPLYFLSSGFGVQLENDQIGARQFTTVSLAYNYQLRLGAGTLALGGSVAWAQLNLDGSKLRTPDGQYDPEDGIFVHNDALLPTTKINATLNTFSAGLYYQSESLEGGLSVDHLSEPVAALDAVDWQLRRVFYGSVRVHLPLGSNLLLHPSVWGRSDAVQTQLDFSLLAEYNNNIFGGASFRGYSRETIDGLAVIAGFKLSEKVRIAYAYDIPLSRLRTVHNGSHEIMINYNLQQRIGAGVPPPIIYHPRAQ